LYYLSLPCNDLGYTLYPCPTVTPTPTATTTPTSTTTPTPTATSVTPTPTATCTPFINNIVISNGSYTATNGTYIRNSASDVFTQVGGTGVIFFGGDAWYLNAGTFGNVAWNTSTLGTGTWNPLPPGNSSGIIADYNYYSCVTPTPTQTPTVTPLYYYYNLLNCNLAFNSVGRSTEPLTGVTYNVDVNTCFTIVGIDLGPSYDYDLDVATLVTDCTDELCGLLTPTPTPTGTSVTPTPTPTITPTEFIFLAQEDYFTIQQEDGSNIIVT
jgi:hypothetical protein